MQKNVGSQTAYFFAFDATTNLPKTGDAANILCYESLDWGSVTQITANSGVPTEVDSTNAKGYYKIALSQGETNANVILFSGKSSTSNVVVIGVPAVVQTVPANFTTRLISSGGYGAIDWANVGNPSTSVNLSATTINLVNTVTTYTGNTPQTGDSFARIGATGSGLTSLAPSATALSTAQWTNTLATNLGTTNSTVATNLDTTVSSRAPSATALSTAQWTNTLATNLGTTNTTVATNLDATISSRAPSSTALSTANWPNGLATSLTTLAGHDPGSTLASATAVAAVNAQNVKTLAAVYDSAASNGTDTLTLSNGATQTINQSTGARTTT